MDALQVRIGRIWRERETGQRVRVAEVDDLHVRVVWVRVDSFDRDMSDSFFCWRCSDIFDFLVWDRFELVRDVMNE